MGKENLCLFVILVCSISTRASLHEFSLPDGRAIKAEIVGYNQILCQVELMREDGRRVKVAPSVFVESDQQFIKQWIDLEGVRNPSLFGISCRKDLVERWKDEEEGIIGYGDGDFESETISETKFERFAYVLDLENHNNFPLEKIKMEYRIFYEQGVAAKRKKGESPQLKVRKKTLPGTLELDRMEPKGKTQLTTETVVVHDKEFLGDFTYRDGNPVKESGEVKGIWVKIFTKSSEKETLVREVFHPSNIEGKYEWEALESGTPTEEKK